MIGGRLAVAASAAALLLALGGCKVDQAREVATYRQVLDAQAPTTRPFVPGQPLSLEEAMVLANQNNERLGLRGEAYLQALIAKDRAAAAFLPQVSLVPVFAAQDTVPGGIGGSDRNTAVDVPVLGRANLFNGFSDLANYRAAAKSIQQQRALLLDAQAAVLLDVARVYYDVLRAERSVDVLRNSLAVQEARVKDMRSRQRAGTKIDLDVAQLAAQASSTRVLLIVATNNVANGRSVLAFLIGAPAQASPLVDALEPPSQVPPVDELEAQAAESRQDLVAAVAAAQAARLEVSAAMGQYYPSVSLNVTYFLSRETPPNDLEWTSLLSANLPLFSAGLIEADVRQAWSVYRQTKLSESALRRQIVQDVEVAYEDLRDSADRLKELQVQVQAAGEAMRQADLQFKAGAGTSLERLIAQDRLLSAQLQLASEQYNQKVFYLSLLRVTGRLSMRLPGEAMPATRPATSPTTLPNAAAAGPATRPARER